MNMGLRSGALREDHASIRVKLTITIVLQERPIDPDGGAPEEHLLIRQSQKS